MRTLVVAALIAVLLAGCSTPRTDPPTTRTDELAAHDGEPCPDVLPGSDVPVSPAKALPDLPDADQGWTCRYVLPLTSGGGDGWHLAGQPRALASADLAAILDEVPSFRPTRADQVCRSDLGPRTMLVVSDRGDLTGLVLDHFGCETVTMTDDPFATPSGQADGGGAVPGELEPTRTFRRLVRD